MAINGQSLQGKRVSEAMHLLQSCPDKVALKIARYVDGTQPARSSHHLHAGLCQFNLHARTTDKQLCVCSIADGEPLLEQQLR